MRLNYLAVRLYILPYRRVLGATCWAHDLQELYIYLRVNSVSIYSKHYFKTLPTGSGVSDPSLRWCHAVKTEFEFRALTCINKPCCFGAVLLNSYPLQNFNKEPPKSSPELLALVPATYKECQFLILNLLPFKLTNPHGPPVGTSYHHVNGCSWTFYEVCWHNPNI